MNIINHPWQEDIVKLIQLCIKHYDKNTDFDDRISFLLFDVTIESIFKTFLTLPDGITNNQIPYQKRKEAMDDNFYKLVNIVKEYSLAITNDEITHIQYYHGQRNKLYHQGTGITISHNSTYDFGKLTIDMAKKLLMVDLSQLLGDDLERREKSEKLSKKWQLTVDEFQDIIFQVIEKLEPKIAFPSTQRRMKQIPNNPLQEEEYKKFISENIIDEEIRNWLLGIIDKGISLSLATRNLATMMEWFQDPIYICLLIIGYSTSIGDEYNTSFLSAEEEIEDITNIDGHIFNIYSAVIIHINTLIKYFPPHTSNEVYTGIMESGEKSNKLLIEKTKLVKEWLQRKNNSEEKQ